MDTTNDNNGARMQDIGKLLRERRADVGKSLEDIHEQTKVNVQHLRYIEENNFTFLPETYVKSFIKSFAEALELDGDVLLDQYKANIEEERAKDEGLKGDEKVAVALLQPMNQFIEWILGAGAFILLIGLIFVYVQFKSQMYAQPVSSFQPNLRNVNIDVAEISVHNAPPDTASLLVQPIELQINAKETLWLQLTIDNKDTTGYILKPEHKMSWIAENRFDIILSRGVNASTDKTSDEVVRLSFGKDDTLKTIER